MYRTILQFFCRKSDSRFANVTKTAHEASGLSAKSQPICLSAIMPLSLLASQKHIYWPFDLCPAIMNYDKNSFLEIKFTDNIELILE